MQIKKFLLILGFQLLLVCVLLELGLRILYANHHQTRLLLHSSTAVTRFDDIPDLTTLLERSPNGFKPYTEYQGFVLNSKSFRTPEYAVDKPNGVYRVVALGDSFTFASGSVPYSDHWTTRLEQGLSRKLGQPVEVINLGVAGVGLQFALRVWQLEGVRLNPDLVVLGLFVGNDFTDDAGRAGIALSSDTLWDRLADISLSVRAARNISRIVSGVDALPDTGAENDPTPSRGQDRAGTPRGGYEIPAYREQYDPLKASFTEARYAEIEARRMEICLRENRPRFDKLLERAGTTLDALHREVSSSGAQFLAMIIPDEYQVDPAVTAAALAHAGRTAEDYDLALPQRALADFFRESGIEFLDLYPGFRDATAGGSLYRLRNTHWNREGNTLAAEQLVQHIANTPRLH